MNERFNKIEFIKSSPNLLGPNEPPSSIVPAISEYDSNMLELGAVQAVTAMQKGFFTAETYAKALLAQAERWSLLNVFCTMDNENLLTASRALDNARNQGKALGLLHGLPIPVKDSVNTSSFPTSNGTMSLKNFRPAVDAGIIKLIKDEGAIIMGKTNLHEISFGWTSNNENFGPVRNPYDMECSTGGSSGGSAAAVSSKIAPLAVAEDTWGSIRLPASFCGLVGFRPSRGRYPDDGVMPLTKSFDQVGSLARFVEDVILFDQVAASDYRVVKPLPLNQIVIAIPVAFWEGLDPEVERVSFNAITRLRDAGASIIDVSFPIKDIEKSSDIVGTIVSYELKGCISAFLKQQKTGVSFDNLYANLGANTKNLVDSMVLSPNTPSREAYENAIVRKTALTSALTSYMRNQGVHALAYPAAMVRAPKIGEEDEVMIEEGRKISAFDAFGRNVALGSCAGMTSLVLSAGLARNGMPIGIEFANLKGHDRELLALGLSLEKALGSAPLPEF
ncbi:amidase family protein [Sodalis sp. RH22]|uniref:amidase family protein n=1 Tax=unclassified Sodalis (in: enterobacteria) TaxID=2636512 RepID=UPI0039B60882